MNLQKFHRKEAQDKCVNEKYVKEEGSAPLPSVYN